MEKILTYRHIFDSTSNGVIATDEKGTVSLINQRAAKILGVKIKAVPAYNINKEFHPKGNDWLGYIFTINNITFYHMGDSDFIQEMEDITADVVFVPVSGSLRRYQRPLCRLSQNL